MAMRHPARLIFLFVWIASLGFGPVSGADTTTIARTALTLGGAGPISLASADFDGDGVPDLVCGHAGPSGGALSLHQGNLHAIFPYRPEARQWRLAGGLDASPFNSPARIFEIEIRPDFIAAGDFDNDGHWDVVFAEAGDDALYLAAGDGQLGLLPPRTLPLAGRITALTAGEINRADGLADLVVAIDSVDGPAALVFEGPHGAWLAEPEILPLTEPARALALGQVAGDLTQDLILVGGDELIVFEGRDRRLTAEAQRRKEVPPPVVRAFALESGALAVAVTDRVPGTDPRSEVAVLLEDGTLPILGFGDTQEGPRWITVAEHALSRAWELEETLTSAVVVPVRMSGAAAEDLVVLGPGENRMYYVPGSDQDRSGVGPAVQIESIELADRPLAAIPMRLSPAAQHQIVLALRSGLDLVEAGIQATIVVDSAADTAVAGDGACTLREAIANANANGDATAGDCAGGAGTDSIVFNIGGGGSTATIALTSELPFVSDPVTINGNTQGCAGPPCIVLNGAATVDASGLSLTGGDSSVRGLVIQEFDAAGLDIDSHNNYIEGCFVGTDVSGTAASPNGSPVSGFAGIDLRDAPNNTIGGTTVAARNVVSGNAWHGIYVRGGGATGNQIQGNFIGTDVSGTAPLANAYSGCYIREASNNLVGGAIPGAGNLISGNDIGLSITSFAPYAQNNNVQGNRIGTDVSGTSALGNLRWGVHVGGSARFNRVGSVAIGAGNLISANGTSGVFVDDEAIFNNFLGNRIGTDVTGTEALGNLLHGMELETVQTGATIGGVISEAGNLISANGGHGIWLAPETGPTTIQGNLIGTDVSGTILMGNGMKGVMIDSPVGSAPIGGTSPGAGNVIAGNGEDGIAVDSYLTVAGITIQGNSIFANGGLGIDLGADGVTSNDPQDPDAGENWLQNYPLLASANATHNSVTIIGSFNSTPGRGFRIEFFASSACDSTGHGEGERYLGSRDVWTDPAGDAAFNVGISTGVGDGEAITATASTRSTYPSTSEFAACIGAVCPQTYSMGQSLEAQDANTFGWGFVADVRFVKGDLADVGAYLTTGGGWLEDAMSLDVSLDNPAPGNGLYYLARLLGCGSWQTVLGDEPERDLTLP